jgi:hypothetical protein
MILAALLLMSLFADVIEIIFLWACLFEPFTWELALWYTRG